MPLAMKELDRLPFIQLSPFSVTAPTQETNHDARE
jgi:hypothetical protein